MKIVNLSVDKVEPFVNDKYKGFVFEWSANIGWGQYTFYTSDGVHWKAESEHMDKGEDKNFVKMLWEEFIKNNVDVVE